MFVFIFALVIRWIESVSLSRDCRANKGEPYTSIQKARPLKIKEMQEELQQVANLITANTIFTTKEILTSDEVAKYMGISKSYLYKLTMSRKIPHFKPMGKMCYFNRLELEQWLQGNRIAIEDDIKSDALNYCQKGGKR